jgi:hypothetical protein
VFLKQTELQSQIQKEILKNNQLELKKQINLKNQTRKAHLVSNMCLDEMLWNKNYIKSSIMKDSILAA